MKKLLLCCLAIFINFYNFAQANKRIATVDWTVAETLISLGINPVAVGDLKSYSIWVKEPVINKEYTVDLGNRLQPNLELISSLNVDLFINTPMYALISTKLEKYAPVESVDFTADSNIWDKVVMSTKAVATYAGETAKGEDMIDLAEQTLAKLKTSLAGNIKSPIAVIQFADSKHFRLYAKNSIAGMVLDKLGLPNAYDQNGNLWGFVNQTIDKLADLPADTILVVVKPYPIDLPAKLKLNSLWNYLPVSKNLIILDSTWLFGGIPSSLRFANALVNGLQGESEQW
ncbi:hypothetical protein CKF54_07795 [Psittacicella hinzii]|uniref:Fe/B12 periplasmic-binding domain-containing protein n=1 Tax=Psittacicella hinzii TaxID=2028575 RepID=A0A3A1Y4Z4_9GAMM|nr:iron-siderophore ABC transporter substrate-binding protein [Psittacicella hinzii]RIY31084.1 hypothetical protein CKF54_07795 [Psittacicella hinzii]